MRQGGVHELLLCDNVRESPERIVCVVTGNPGLPGFYANFADSLAEDLNAQVAVIGLTNHVSRPSIATWIGRAQGSIPRDDMRAVFDSLDIDQSGAISVEELGDAARRLGRSISQRALSSAIQRVDSDRSGAIEFDEFVEVLSEIARPSLFRRLATAKWRSIHALDAQLAHLRAAIRPFAAAASERGVPFTIIGHSIGAWLVLQVLAAEARSSSGASSGGPVGHHQAEALVDPSTTSALLLMPFLENNLADVRTDSFRP